MALFTALNNALSVSVNVFKVFLIFHDWCNKGCGMCYPICEMMHIKEPLLVIGKSSLCDGSGFPLPI